MKIILISGKIGSGKDTTAAILKRILEEKGYKVTLDAFAKPLKEAVAYMRGEDKGLFYNRDGKDKEDKSIRRKLLIAVGESANKIDPTIFARFIYNKNKVNLKGNKDILIITDLRKVAELSYISVHNKIYIVRLVGSFKPCKDKEIATSPIECELDTLDVNLKDNADFILMENMALFKPRPTGEDCGQLNAINNLIDLKIIANAATNYLINK